MDPVSHLVVARSLEYVRHRRSAEPGETLAVALGALAPDIDALLMPTGWDRYLAAHEIGTHSLAGTMVCGTLAAGVAGLGRRTSRYQVLVPAALIGSISHLVLDVLSGAAVRIGWPLFDTRVANLGAFAMADPFLVIASALTLLAWARLRACRRGIAIVLLVVMAFGISVKTWSRVRALDAYRAAAVDAEGLALIEPVWGSWTRWSVFDRTVGSVRTWRATGGSPPEAHMAFAIPRRPTSHPASTDLLTASTRWETVRNLLRAHDMTFATIGPDDPAGGTRVMWSDIRYCRSPDACEIRAGGVVSESGHVQLRVEVGDWVQTR